MYLVGGSHPHKTDAQRLLDRAVADHEPLATDAEVFQEILHRYTAIHRWDAIQPAFDALLGVVDQVFSVDVSAIERAKTIVLGRRHLSARDAIHVAIMELNGIDRIMSFDAGFDGYSKIHRLS
jgi:predicted nucleic acid-binding protein